MSLWTRMANVFRGERVNREIDEELEAHVAEAMASGRDAEEARRALGSPLRHREESRDARIVTWLDSLRADAVFGWRQLKKTKVTSAAAILSLALAIGACTAAFRLIDALLLRPLPVAGTERLYLPYRSGIGWDGKPESFDGWAYPAFRRMRDVVKEQAELLAISYGERVDLTYKSDQEMEKAQLQYVSGATFGTLGLRPELGRLLMESDDLTPGAHPYAVLSHDYWANRFGQDPKVVGRTFRIGNQIYEIVGVAEKPFTGTEPGIMTDIFVPTMMHPDATRPDSTWIRIFALLKPGANTEQLRAMLFATSQAFEAERAKGFKGMSQQAIDNYVNQAVILEPAPTGASGFQTDNRASLAALGVLVGLVLLIACANVANLMTAQAAARAREMALRISIGAGRWRLVQLVLVEGAWIALLAAGMGWLFAWWAAPFVVGMIGSPDNPVRVPLPADWRVMGFGLALTLVVMFLFGLIPALRVSAIKPASALKGGEDPHSRRRLMHALIAAQVAFCFLVLFVAGLFVATFDRLAHQSTGFSAERLLILDTVAQHPQAPEVWDQVADQLRAAPGVERVALADRALLGGYASNDYIAVNGGPPIEVLAFFLKVSPGWVDEMKIPFVDGRDFLPNETSPGAAIVNETFARTYFHGENPVGKSFERASDEGPRYRFQVVGLVRDARYRSMREAILPTAYIPLHSRGDDSRLRPFGNASIIVRTAGRNPLQLASMLREEVPRVRPEFRVSRIRTQQEINDSQTVRERLLAMLAGFFSVVALLLAGVGLYGVLHYSVLQRHREIGIRIAVGAQGRNIAGLVTAEVFAMVAVGAVAGVALGLISVRYLESLFYQVRATDVTMLAFPALSILGAALLASVIPVIRAVRIDPATMLRAE
jgi:putative ABC transport system permease protein